MRRLFSGGATLGALAVVLCAFGAHAQEPTLAIKPPTWANDTQFEYAIYDGSQNRTATAYYRILKEKTGTKTLYHFKYMGRNDKMSESAEVWLDPATMHPVRSTRKLVSGGRTLFVDCAYTPNKIVVRHKYAGQPVTELDIPVQQAFFDFEELMWLPAQLQWTKKEQSTYLNYFNTFRFQQETTVVYRDGMDKIEINGKTFPAVRYRFLIGSTQYNYWTVDQNGREVPAKLFMDDADNRKDVTFLDLKLSLKDCKASPAAWAAKALPPPVQAGMPSVAPIPLPPGMVPDKPFNPNAPGQPGQPEPGQPRPYPDQPDPDQPYPQQPGGGGDQPQPGDNPFAPPPDGGGG